ncbi:50S ribosomal protein 6, chloroplastic [Heracleum sosnowskyi]|uniref:50S ribosomal protein 6, chloroplastic n=1 Tax=Heracleum sosnowskyi TaxID=360622 RepID=A0AAD8JLI1_9APIA|nr:50S ribosomal protein 6, chloroplastic [Heracleum sosnowskyi]
MSASAIFGCRLFTPPPVCSFPGATTTARPRVEYGGLVIENSSRPQKKATAHHRKSRPKKTQPWDVKRGPCVYPPLPEMPSEWTLVSEENAAAAAAVVAVEAEPVPA